MLIGATELPPESDDCEPMSPRSSPREPVFMMPYIGLWGLLLVSFSERAAIAQPLVSPCVPALVR